LSDASKLFLGLRLSVAGRKEDWSRLRKEFPTIVGQTKDDDVGMMGCLNPDFVLKFERKSRKKIEWDESSSRGGTRSSEGGRHCRFFIVQRTCGTM
jgi:hypothetical protein